MYNFLHELTMGSQSQARLVTEGQQKLGIPEIYYLENIKNLRIKEKTYQMYSGMTWSGN